MGKYRVLVKCIVNYGSDYLLLQKWYDDRIDEPYQWEFPDGEVDFGESPEHAAERIVAETAGLTAEAAKPLYTWQYMLGDTSNIGICYLLYAHQEDVILSEAYSEFKWINRFDFEKFVSNPLVLKDIDRAGL